MHLVDKIHWVSYGSYISFKTGHGIVLQTNGSSSKYLDSNVNTQVKSQSVYLSDAIGPGSLWEVIVLSNNIEFA